jgi:hypothetical protein
MTGEGITQSSDGHDTPQPEGSESTEVRDNTPPSADWTPDQSSEHHEDATPPEGSKSTEARDNTPPSADWTPDQSAVETDNPKPMSSIDHDDGSTKLTPEEEQRSLGRINNQVKAEVMAYEEDSAHERNEELGYRGVSPEARGERAGQDYDLGTALNKERWIDVKTPEDAQKFATVSRGIFLKYSHVIVESYQQHGEQIPLTLKALDLVYELAKDVGYNNFDTVFSDYDSKRLLVELDESNGGAVVVRTRQQHEQWRLPMFGRGEYTVSQVTSDPEGQFGNVETKKTRSLREEDVAKLDTLLKPAIKYREQQKKRQQQAYYEDEDDDMLRPGDAGYEDAMRDEHYGRDGTNGKSYLEQNYGIKP